ncbi:Wzz/FepE/Etk N-terminal domain-containing protein [Teredinibacter turnerae]|uniref:Wzz/FepE/Etk N-terminal domain-containing protein n=1 Tax=Teredinibacter turnerae TaxID=2426 RepID=UPI00036146D3|nr:Wzz/FepE/Etk N-terminal domain-containing protein [Teredinibacter turnerae]
MSNSENPNRYYLELGSVPESLHLVDIGGALWRAKWVLLVVIAVFVGAFAVLAMITPVKYTAEVVVAEANAVARTDPGSDSAVPDIGVDLPSNEALAMITSRDFINRFIEDNNLLPVLYRGQWNAQTQNWKLPAEAPTLWQAYKRFSRRVLDVGKDAESGLIRISVSFSQPELAAEWANKIVAEVNEVLRANAIREAEETLAYLNQELQRTASMDLKASLNELVKAQKARVVAANVHKQYAFRIVDPAVVPEEPAIPKLTLLLIILGTVLGTFVGVTGVLLHHLVQRTRRSAEAHV